MEGAEAEGDALDGGRGERDGTFLLWISTGLGERILPRINCFYFIPAAADESRF